MDEELLINLVEKYSELYDVNDSKYHDQARKENIWEEIAAEMQKPARECKKRWSTLRDCYRRALKAQQSKSGDGAKAHREWRFQQQMSFLRGFLPERQQLSNVEIETAGANDTEREEQERVNSPTDYVQQSESDESSTSSRPQSTHSAVSIVGKRKSNKNQPLTTAHVLQSYLAEKRTKNTPLATAHSPQPLKKFFASIEDTVSTFPLETQLDIKSKIFNIVHQAELSLLRHSTGNINQSHFHQEHHQQYYPSQVQHIQPHFIPMTAPQQQPFQDIQYATQRRVQNLQQLPRISQAPSQPQSQFHPYTSQTQHLTSDLHYEEDASQLTQSLTTTENDVPTTLDNNKLDL
ncbi:mastermind-like domain-containing protein 1 [Photinus pyralis]|uniref:mastermind-like domain-containing protein 1 n=1 Tax=Photinus pyralis TaxID=7054 RepID=UPI0012674AB3|nr:mastermind-like domain-containing protein 1 [Photinus pyralis]